MLVRSKLLGMLLAALTVAAAAGFGVAAAATRSSTFAVSVTITAGCTTRAADLAPADYRLGTLRPDPEGAFTVNCTNTAPYSVEWESASDTSARNATWNDDDAMMGT